MLVVVAGGEAAARVHERANALTRRVGVGKAQPQRAVVFERAVAGCAYFRDGLDDPVAVAPVDVSRARRRNPLRGAGHPSGAFIDPAVTHSRPPTRGRWPIESVVVGSLLLTNQLTASGILPVDAS